jgi:hypothetical protein
MVAVCSWEWARGLAINKPEATASNVVREWLVLKSILVPFSFVLAKPG